MTLLCGRRGLSPSQHANESSRRLICGLLPAVGTNAAIENRRLRHVLRQLGNDERYTSRSGFTSNGQLASTAAPRRHWKPQDLPAVTTAQWSLVLAATLASTGTIPVASVALVLGIHRLMSQGLTPTNLIGNAVATIVVAKWERALDEERLHRVLDGAAVPLTST